MTTPATDRRPLPRAAGEKDPPASSRAGPALLLLAAGGLLFEIAITRVLSLLYFSTFSYLVLSIAVLGLAAGAAVAALLPAARQPRHGSLWSALAGLSAAGLTFYAVAAAPAAARLLLLPLTAVPYCFLGLAVTGIFAARAGSSPRLYLADLAGAGAGALLAVPALDLLGAPGAMLLAALGPAAAALLLQPRSVAGLLGTGLAALALLLQQTGVGPAIDLERLSTPKPIRETLQAGGELVASDWNAFARTDLVRQEEAARGGDRYLIYLDGGAASLVPEAAAPEIWLGDIGSLAFAVGAAESVFLIGPGGGLDIALARAFGSDRIVAAEINRSAVRQTRDLTGHAGDLYGSGTELLIDDGRSALRRLGGRFDLILLSQVVSGAAEMRGLALAENGLYTVEAFSSYLDHLAANGRIALKLYDELTLTRALTTAVAALAERGLSQPEALRHLFAVLDTSAQPPVPLLLVNAAPLSEPEAVAWARTAEERGYALLLVPGLLVPPTLAPLQAEGDGLAAVIGGSGEADLRPTTDERPFFYQFERGLPRALRPLVWGVGLLLVAALLLATGNAAARGQGPRLLLAPTLAAGLGAGFMLLEIGVLQRTQLLIGQPALTLAAVLGALLLGAAAGSGVAGRCPAGREFGWIAAASVAAALLGLGWSYAWPEVGRLLGSVPAATAAAGSAVTLLPLAFALGFPFPLLLRSLGRLDPTAVAVAWTLNGTASVAGAVAATALALLFGFGSVAVAAAAAYGLVALLAGFLAGDGSGRGGGVPGQ